MDLRLLWVIIKREVRSLFRGSQSRRSGVAFAALMCGAGVALATGMLYGGLKLFQFTGLQLEALPGVLQLVDAGLLNGLAIFAFMMLFVSQLQMVYRMLYESDDLPFLLSQPVPVGTVFASKYLALYAQMLITNLVFTGPVWAAYGIARKAPASYYPVSQVGIALITLLACSVVSFMMVAIMGFVPGSQMKRITVVAGALFGLSLVLLSQIFTRRMTEANILESLERMGRLGSLGQVWYLPSTWLVSAALGAASGSVSDVFLGLGALFVSSAGLTYLTVALAGKRFLQGWSGSLEEGRRRRGEKVRKETRMVSPRTRRTQVLQGASWAIFKKDITLMVREPMTWYYVLVSVIVLSFFLLNFQRGATGPGAAGGSKVAALEGLLLAMPVLMSAVGVGQLGGISLSLESSRFWILACHPCSGRDVFRAKMAYAFLPQALLCMAFLVVAKIVVGIYVYPVWLALVTTLTMVLAISSFQLLLDALFPDFTVKMGFGDKTTSKNAAKILVNIFASMGVMAGMILILSLPAFPWAQEMFGLRSFWVAVGVLFVGAGGMFALARRVVSSRVNLFLTGWTGGS